MLGTIELLHSGGGCCLGRWFGELADKWRLGMAVETHGHSCWNSELRTQHKLTSCLVPNVQSHFLHSSTITGTSDQVVGARTVKVEV
jgi:hypothetical protein